MPDTQAAHITWQCQRLPALDPMALLRIMRARQQVFTVEQQCIYLDADLADEQCWHLAGWLPGGQLVAYARIVDPGVKYAEASIGRVISALTHRGRGLGREVVRRAIEQAERVYPATALRISAQSQLQAFYASFGFAAVGEPYLEDGLPHQEMLRSSD